MLRRREKKEPTLWTEYPDYNPINNLEERPLYDEAKVSDEHRVLGQIIRENWTLIHSLSRDYMLSSAAEWRSLLNELEIMKSNLETSQHSVSNVEDEIQRRIKTLLIEKEAEFEKAKIDISESFKETLEKKDEEIKQLKMITESIQASGAETSGSQRTNIERDSRIQELEQLVSELRDKAKSQEIEAMNVQTGISKNFQNQINEITKELYERQEHIDRLRAVLSKAKEQLVMLKEKNDELKDSYRQLSQDNTQLEQMIEERDEKLRKVVKTIESLD